MEKINWTDHVKNVAVLHGVKTERNTLHTIKKIWKAKWIGHAFCRNYLLKQLLKEREK